MNTRIFAVTAVFVGLMMMAPAVRSEDAKGASASTAYADLAVYDFGKSRLALTAIEDAIRAGDIKEKMAIEKQLLVVLADPKVSYAAKQFVCRCLVQVGTEASVPALSGMLTDKELSHMARYAIAHVAGKDADKALLNAMKKCDGDLKAGIIGTIGSRKNSDAVDLLADQLSDKNEVIVRAALTALASIGDKAAAKSLKKAGKTMPEALLEVWADACLTAADSLLKSGDVKTASSIYNELYANKNLPATARVGALRGIAESKDGKSAEIIMAAMKDENPLIKIAAGRAIKTVNSAELVKKVLAAFKDYDSAVQVVVLGCVAEMPGIVSGADIMPLCESSDTAVTASAYQIIGKIGNAADVPVLVANIAADKDKNVGAVTALAALGGKDTAEAIVKEIQKADPKVQVVLIKVLAQRNSTQSVSKLMPYIGSQDAAVSGEALKSVSFMGDAGVINEMTGMILTSDKAQKILEAIAAIAKRTDSQDKAMAGLKDVWGKADNAKKALMLAIMPDLGGKDALDLVKSALAEKDDAIYDAAVRALAGWKASDPKDDVLALASTAKTDIQKILALRGFIRMIELENDTAKKFAGYVEAMKLAQRDEDKKLVVTGLGGITTLESYKVVSAFLDDAGLRAEAQVSSLKIAQVIKDSNPADVVEGLKKVLSSPVNDWAKEEAEKIIKVVEAKLPPPVQK